MYNPSRSGDLKHMITEFLFDNLHVKCTLVSRDMVHGTSLKYLTLTFYFALDKLHTYINLCIIDYVCVVIIITLLY